MTQPLPDIDEQGWNAYQQSQFQDEYQRRIGALDFQHRTMARIQELNAMAAPPRMAESTVMPAPGMLPPLPAPPQLPAPTLPGFQIPSPQTAPPMPEPLPSPILPQPRAPSTTPYAPQPVIGEPAPQPMGVPQRRPSGPITAPTPFPNASDLAPTPFPRLGGTGTATAPRPTFAQDEVPPGGDLRAYARQAALRNNIDPDLFVAQIQQESGFNPTAGSPAGARGIAQIVPSAHPGVDVNDPYASLDYAAQLDASHLKKYGGNTDLMLAAYNAGAGAVDKYGGVPPYKETQEYIRRINANVAANAPTGAPTGAPQAGVKATAMQQSQLGDPQLTTDEAYSACGPAAAVRFAQAYGRNPTLREAVDLAKSVGWSASSGMAGIGSEQQLLQKMGVETKLVAGNQWDQFAQEAQTGNPITISTPGHYFYADGYNPKTGQFHVGRSGLDLAHGAEWMTPEQMEGLMGRAQGALFASNPTVQAPSTAISTTQDLDQQRQMHSDALLSLSSYAPAPRAMNANLPTLGSLDRAVEMAYQPPSQQARTPNLNAAGDGSPLDNLGSMIGNAIQSALSSVLGGGGPPGGDRSRDDQQKRTQEDVARQFEMRNPFTGESMQRELGLPDLTPPKSINEAIERATQDALRRGLPSPGPNGQLGILDPKLGSPFENPEDVLGISSLLDDLANGISRRLPGGGTAAERAGQVLEDVFNSERAAPRASAVIDAASRSIPRNLPGKPLGSLLPDNTFERTLDNPTPRSSLRKFFDRVTYEFTDRNMSLNQLQEQAQKELGRPLQPDEMVGFLNRLSPGGAQHVLVDNHIGPIVREVGQHYDSFVDYLNARSNVSTAEAIGRQAMREAADAPVSATLTNEVRWAERELASRKADLEDLVNSDSSVDYGVRQALINRAERSVSRAEEMLQRRQDAVAAAQQQIVEGASTYGQDIAQNRLFAGGMTRDSSQELLDRLQQELPPEVWDLFHGQGGAGDRFFDFGRKLRDQLVDSSVMSREEADQLAAEYPEWFRRHALDYMNDNSARGLPAGQRLGLSNRSLREYTLEGSARSIQNPVEGMISYADQVGRMSSKNRAANALLKLDEQVAEPQMRQVVSPTDYAILQNQGEDMSRYATTVGPGEKEMYVFRDGEKQKWVTDNPYYIQAIEGAQSTNLPTFAMKPANLVRSLATARNPAFLVGNTAADVPTYLARTTAEGGLKNFARGDFFYRTLPELLSGYADAFKGLNPLSTPGGWVGGAAAGGATAAATDEEDPNRAAKIAIATALGTTLGGRKALTGRFEGEATQRYLSQGGGMSGQYRAFEPKEAAARAAELRRAHVFDIKGPQDLKRIIDGLTRMRWVESLGQRVELGPRVAAMRVAERRGLDPVRATIAGRDVTVDFDRGGRVVKFLNQFMPFLNAGVQGSMNTVRMLRNNPGGSAAALGSLVAVPTIAAEAWNRSDPQREKDYEDVPDYIKNQGVVIMLPTEAPVDKDGNRHPQYIHINMRELSPVAIAARDAAERYAGKGDPKSWQELAGEMVAAGSPVQASNLNDFASRFMGLPAAHTLQQLATNTDSFRNSTIVSAKADQNASPLAKAVTPWLQRGLEAFDPNTSSEIRPSAIDFIVRDTLSSLGSMALGASRAAANEPHDNQLQNTPLLGAFTSRLVGGSTGGELDKARGEVLTPSARQALRAAGLQWTPSPVSNAPMNIPLRQEEQTRLQQLTNRYVDTAIQKLVRSANFQKATPANKERYLSSYVDNARQKAQVEVLRTIPQKERSARMKSGSSKG